MTRLCPVLRWPAACVALGLLAGCMVPNPDYQSWARFAVGSSVTFEGEEASNGDEYRLRLIEKLVAKDPLKLVFERTCLYLDDEAAGVPAPETIVEPVVIFPTEHPLTHPLHAKKRLPDEELEVAGKAIRCKVTRFTVKTASETLFGNWRQEVTTTLHQSDQVPGGVVRIVRQTVTPDQTSRLCAQAVDIEVVEE